MTAPFEAAVMNQLLGLGVVIVPMLVAAALYAHRKPNMNERGALVFSVAWVGVGVLALNEPMVNAGWWSYGGGAPMVLSMSAPLLIGWMLVWGVIAPLLALRTAPTVAILGALDLVVMSQLEPLVVLHDGWLVGEAIFLVVVAAPGIAAARAQAVASQATVNARLCAQGVLALVALIWVAPGLAIGELGLPQPPLLLVGVVVGLIGAAVLPGALAVAEFGLHNGTPWPWDQTDRPIRSGPYRYMRSPIQASGMATVVALGAVHGSWKVLASSVVALAWSAWFSSRERVALAERWEGEWTDPALDLHPWIPALRPHPGGETAVLWTDLGCDICTSSTSIFRVFSSEGLEVRDARDYPEPLTRLRYERADGVCFDGLAAYGAALEHLNLGAAMLGWLLRAPGLAPIFQLIADASGLGPRLVSNRPAPGLVQGIGPAVDQ